jgi:arylsulfatase
LFNLADDPAERFDLATTSPDKLEDMQGLWAEYVAANNVIVPSRSIFETMEKQMPRRVPDDPGYPPLTYKRQFVPPNDMLAPPKQ